MIAPPTHVAERRATALRARALGALLAASLLLPAPSQAQPQPAADAALAETLFQDGKKLHDEGRHAEACPKLAESQRLDPAGGTILLLGLCYEGSKKWASAWAAFNDALGMAIKDGRKDREQRARERLVAVEAKMARLKLVIPASLESQAGLEIRREGKEIPRAAWTSTLPIDPGRHRLTATAPGKQPWATELNVPDEGGGLLQVQLPPSLTDAPAASAPPSAPPPPASTTAPPPASTTAPAATTTAATTTAAAGPRYLSYALGAVGLVGLGVGVGFGLRALSKSSQADEICPAVDCADPRGVDLSSDARSAARVSNVAFVVGVAGLTAGALLLLLDPPARPGASARLRLSPAPTAHGDRLTGGVMHLGGSFLCESAWGCSWARPRWRSAPAARRWPTSSRSASSRPPARAARAAEAAPRARAALAAARVRQAQGAGGRAAAKGATAAQVRPAQGRAAQAAQAALARPERGPRGPRARSRPSRASARPKSPRPPRRARRRTASTSRSVASG